MQVISELPYDNVDQIIQVAEEAIQQISDELRALSLKIHEHPEVAFQETHAHRWLTDYIKRQGFTVDSVADMPTAFIATCHVQSSGDQQKTGRTIAFMSEYDALPEIGHGCGHNLIAISGVAAAVGCLRALQHFKVSATVKLYGTPAEENGDGKVIMLEKHLFADAHVCLMAHPANHDAYLPKFLALQPLHITYHGRSSHAASAPWDGVNALDAVVASYQSIGLLRQQMLPSQRVHGIITNGGSAPNVIPDLAAAHYYIRSEERPQLDALRERVVNCFAAAATATGCTHTLDTKAPVNNVHSNSILARAWGAVLEKRGVEFETEAKQYAAPHGSTDMGNVTWYRPGIHPVYDIGTKQSLHTKEFAEVARTLDAHQRCLRAALGLAVVGVRAAADDPFYQQARREFDDTTA